MANYDDYPDSFTDKYEKPVVEDFIAGFSGLDPDRKVKPENIDHEELGGLVGGDFLGHYHLTEEQVDKLESYEEKIQNAREEAKSKIEAVKDEAEQRLAQIDEAVAQIASDVDSMEETVSDLEDTTDFLGTRMEVIVGQATEDTEILDARVDADGVVHQNLGSNVRNLHAKIHEVIGSIKEGAEEFRGLLRQLDLLATAQIQGEINRVEANDRRKAEIRNEALIRLAQDDGLQRQIDTVAHALIDACITLHRACEKFRKRVSAEKEERQSRDVELQSSINAEVSARQEEQDKLQSKIEENKSSIQNTAEALSAEARERSEHDGILEKQIAEIRDGIDDEHMERIKADLGLARQASATAEAIMRTALSLVEFNRRRKADILREEGERRNYDRGLQGEINTLSGAVIGNSYAIHQEAEKRRSENKKQREESFNNKLIIEEQIKKLVLALLEQSVIISDEAYKRRDNIDKLKKILFEKADNLQKQVNKICYSILEGAIRLHKEAEQRRREDIAERFARFSGIEDMREQIDTLSEAVIELATILSKTNSTVRTLGSTVETLEISASEAGTNFASNEEFQAMFSDIL